MSWKSVEEINKTYNDHIDSLRLSGLPFDLAGLEAARDEEIDRFLNPDN